MGEARISQRAFADQTSISQSTIFRIISGQRTAKLPEIIQIVWATGWTVAKIRGPTPYPTGSSAPRGRYCETVRRRALPSGAERRWFQDASGALRGFWSGGQDRAVRSPDAALTTRNSTTRGSGIPAARRCCRLASGNHQRPRSHMSQYSLHIYYFPGPFDRWPLGRV
ncbi:helix-turn-helix domain-containing protein [Paeniglutamicibacter sp. Y32M11]|uniref:helix-turn-helix domain-containing protein n=1 Tax=Paeniglutamicibacter sp. Y32M11 TaxID=2853258 RepID=UPI00351CD664